MPLFVCRWQNGDFSAVSAASREVAIELLNEVGNADGCELLTVPNFMVHFRIKKEVDNIGDLVPVELEGFGEGNYEFFCDRVYPIYCKASKSVEEDWPDSGTYLKIKEHRFLKG